MKRISLLLIPVLLVSLLLCSCNADAQDGIFSAIADSAPDAGIKVQAYLGMDTTNSYHYILTDTGVFCINDPSFSIKNSEGIRIIQACIIDDYIYVHSTTSNGKKDLAGSMISRYSKEGVKDSSFTEIENVKGLLINGSYYTCDESEKKQTIHFPKTNTSTDFFSETETKTINTLLESGDYVFAELSDKSYVVFNSKNGTKVFESTKDTLSSPIKGFQTIDSSLFLIVQSDNKVYSITSEGLDYTNTTLSTISGNETHTFHYNMSGKDYIVIKGSNSFTIYEIEKEGSEYRLLEVKNPTAPYVTSSLRTTEVSNIMKKSDTCIIFATYSNSIWEIDPTSTNDPVEIK